MKKKIVFTNGCFDLIHAGHVRYLKKAKAQGDVLVVGLNTDASVRKLKGKGRPLMPEKDRAEILSALRMVDRVVMFGEETPLRLIKQLKPDVLVKGADYRKEEVVGAKEVESWGGKVVLIPLLKGRSTSRLIKKLECHSRG